MASLTAGVGPSLPRASSSAPWKQLVAPGSQTKRRPSFPLRSSSSRPVVCCRSSEGDPPPASVRVDPDLVLHDALDSSGVDTSHARAARGDFCAQIGRLSNIERGTSISINRAVDLARTALYVAAEDDSVVSHSSVPLPVDAFIDRLDDLSMGYCSHFESAYLSAPQKFLNSVEDYLYAKKGFHRSNARGLLEPRALYLHSVLTHRSGSATMLSLLYSEILKMLRLWGIVNFDAEIFFPHDLESLPRGYDKRKGKEVDQQHVLTSEALLHQMLTDLKTAFWPFQSNRSESLFLRAANAANCGDQSGIGESSAFQLASTKAAHHRLERGIWTGVRLGDMRRALAACERLILLDVDPRESRDYAILLYHCGFYEQALQHLSSYQKRKVPSPGRPSDPQSSMEEDAGEKLMVRLNLLMMEEGWGRPSQVRYFLGNKAEPW
ncbi:hypothetical protein MLD38_024075 [Melastoma candidum]|uniref:Uncharacterized protein n=1 Tax=Melastoma candidum TaxID=119954 RepID=A0ACB9NR87_9MYRT|nr:hypothetical protein MLD38_024075 [Melastoma candidum]